MRRPCAATLPASLAGKTGWLTAILEHHVQIEACFAEVKNATSETGRKKGQKQLALVLTGHSIAEESVIYPALAACGRESGSDELYAEQSNAKVEMAALDNLEPMSPCLLGQAGTHPSRRSAPRLRVRKRLFPEAYAGRRYVDAIEADPQVQRRVRAIRSSSGLTPPWGSRALWVFNKGCFAQVLKGNC